MGRRAAAAILCAVLAAPALAEPEPEPSLAVTTERPEPKVAVERQRQVVVRAIRNCPTPKTPDEIVVCSRDRGVAEAYRLPKIDPRLEKAARGDRPEAGGLGAGQALASGDCSAVGSAGQTGCALGAANAWGAERRAQGLGWGRQ
ncbi:MAG: hypothetical protein PGN09_13265 [Sphingomonas fennica]